MSFAEFQIIDIPKIINPQGNLAIVENDTLPFDIKRVYYLYDIPSNAARGGHAHKSLQQVLIAISGSFEVVLNNGNNQQVITLNKPDKGLLIPNGWWRELQNFSAGSVCLVLASEIFNEDDYIRSFDAYLEISRSRSEQS